MFPPSFALSHAISLLFPCFFLASSLKARSTRWPIPRKPQTLPATVLARLLTAKIRRLWLLRRAQSWRKSTSPRRTSPIRRKRRSLKSMKIHRPPPVKTNQDRPRLMRARMKVPLRQKRFLQTPLSRNQMKCDGQRSQKQRGPDAGTERRRRNLERIARQIQQLSPIAATMGLRTLLKTINNSRARKLELCREPRALSLLTLSSRWPRD